jgi:hypothetical protein
MYLIINFLYAFGGNSGYIMGPLRAEQVQVYSNSWIMVPTQSQAYVLVSYDGTVNNGIVLSESYKR